jgi:glutathione-regulated potassium-efflux system ancillary protein KefF
MKWLPSFAIHFTFVCDENTLDVQAEQYKQHLLTWQEVNRG